MIAGLKPYAEMKDSAAPWLGAVPTHWEVRSLGSLATSISLRGRPDLPLLSVVREKGVIPRKLTGDDANHNFIPDDLSNYKVVRAGNLVINKMKAWQGSLGIAPMDGIVSPAYFVFDLAVDDRHFGQALLRSKTYVSFFARASDGVRIGQWDLSIDGMKRIPVVLPPQDEQAAIVRFLDHADRRIRRTIQAKQRLVKLLEEQKQAIIHRAVTRGLDPDVPLKPSGVEWLGDVPEHWEVVRFKQRVGFQEGPGIMAADFRDAGVPLLRISCLRGEVASLDGCNYLDPEMVKRRWSHFSVGAEDYLLSASASTGAVVFASAEVAGAIPYTGILRLWSVSGNTFMPFVRLYMGCSPFQGQIEAAKSGVAISHFGPTHLKRMFICLPGIEEQQNIVEELGKSTAPFAGAVERARREIALLLEYRTRLIADVVTGKLDVREAAARLPDAGDVVNDDCALAEGDEDGVEEGLESEDEAVVA